MKAKANDVLKVRATQAGYFGNGELGPIYRYPGDVFVIRPREIEIFTEEGKMVYEEDGRPKTRLLSTQDQFSALWMEIVPDNEPERLTTAKDGIARAEQELTRKTA